MIFNRLIAEKRNFPREPRATFRQVRHAIFDLAACPVFRGSWRWPSDWTS